MTIKLLKSSENIKYTDPEQAFKLINRNFI